MIFEFSQHGAYAYGLAGQFVGAWSSLTIFGCCSSAILGGALLLVNRFVLWRCCCLGRYRNIICYHVFLNSSGAVPAVVTVLC